MVNPNDSMPVRLTKIDDLIRAHHRHLDPDDDCYYWGEYQVRGGYRSGPTNQLIRNLKILPTERNASRLVYKGRAITQVGSSFSSILATDTAVTVVPVPCSKAPGHPDYDDRMLQIARLMVHGSRSEAREIVRQTESYDASHIVAAGARVTVERLLEIYAIPARERTPHQDVIILDDVLTQGTHFRAMKTKIVERFPGTRVVGVFIARAVHNAAADFDVL